MPTVTDAKGKEQFPKDITFLRDAAKKIIKVMSHTATLWCTRDSSNRTRFTSTEYVQ